MVIEVTSYQPEREQQTIMTHDPGVFRFTAVTFGRVVVEVVHPLALLGRRKHLATEVVAVYVRTERALEISPMFSGIVA